MIEIIFLAGILCLRVLQKISTKAISNDIPASLPELISYKSIFMATSAVFALVLLLFDFSATDFTELPFWGWAISLATGLTICISSVCSLLAMHGSSILLNSLFGMSGLLIPTISGIFIFNQKVSGMQWLGILLLFVAALLLTASSKKTNGKLSAKTIVLLFVSMLANGTTMLLQVLYKNYIPTGNVLVYSFLQFAITAMVLLILALILLKKAKAKFFIPSKKLMCSSVISAGSLFGISQLSTMASAVVPIAILFPVSDGGGMIISALVADLLYKEKMNFKSIMGMIIGVFGILCMKLFS